VLFEGSDNSNGAIFGDTWIWDGVTWALQFEQQPLFGPCFPFIVPTVSDTVRHLFSSARRIGTHCNEDAAILERFPARDRVDQPDAGVVVGLCQRPSEAMSTSASFGPQLPRL
jgi:hypothetical protein